MEQLSEERLIELASLGERLQATQLGAALQGWTISEKIDADEALKDLEQHPGYKALVRLLDEARESALVTLIHAPRTTDNAAALQKQIGLVKGLEAFKVAIPTIREKARDARIEREAAVKAADAEMEQK